MNALAALLIFAPFQGSTAFGSDFILTDKQAYLVLPPQAVGGPQTTFISWSPSGRYLLMGQLRPKMTPALLNAVLAGNQPGSTAMAISIWDKVTNRTIEVGSISDFREPLTWLAEKDVTLDLHVENIGDGKERASLIRIDGNTGKLAYIPIAQPIPEGVFYRLFVSPAAPQAVVIETKYERDLAKRSERSTSSIWAIDDFGRGKSHADFPPGSPGMVQWLQDGKSALIRFRRAIPEVNRIEERFVFDTATGKLAMASTGISIYQPHEKPVDLKVLLIQMRQAPASSKQPVYAASIHATKASEKDEFTLSPRADFAALNSTIDAASVLDQGVVTVRLLAPVPMEVYLQAKTAAEKSKALNEVKQIGTAAHMFGADNGDRFPTQEEFQNRVLHPYMKNDATFEGFVYTFAGGSYENIKDPVRTVLGYKSVAGGFAVVFADSHAQWLKELPRNP